MKNENKDLINCSNRLNQELKDEYLQKTLLDIFQEKNIHDNCFYGEVFALFKRVYLEYFIKFMSDKEFLESVVLEEFHDSDLDIDILGLYPLTNKEHKNNDTVQWIAFTIGGEKGLQICLYDCNESLRVHNSFFKGKTMYEIREMLFPPEAIKKFDEGSM